jgi:hypothetical protein
MSQMYSDVGDKDTAIPLFKESSIENKRESRIQGRPVFDTVAVVEIIVPGSRDIVCRPVEEKDKERWPKQYAQFLNKQKQTVDGTPIDELSTATASERATCKALNVMTIEGLKSFPDTSIHKLGPGGHALKRKAVAFLSSRGDASYATALQEEVARLREQIASLKLKLEERDVQRSKESGD